jgi:hypothetical protein
MESPGYQSFTVLSLCRILYTLRHSDVVSKQMAAHWVIENLGDRWAALIEQSLRTRHSGAWENSGEWETQAGPIEETLNFIRYTAAHT